MQERGKAAHLQAGDPPGTGYQHHNPPPFEGEEAGQWQKYHTENIGLSSTAQVHKETQMDNPLPVQGTSTAVDSTLVVS